MVDAALLVPPCLLRLVQCVYLLMRLGREAASDRLRRVVQVVLLQLATTQLAPEGDILREEKEMCTMRASRRSE